MNEEASMKTFTAMILWIAFAIFLSAAFTSVFYSFVKWEWSWFFDSWEGWRFFVVTAIFGVGSNRR
jgi:hypothetical protein